MRGLKYDGFRYPGTALVSHLTRGAWIEILQVELQYWRQPGRTSHEVRGLKYDSHSGIENYGMSHLTRGAWIEIFYGLWQM